MQNHDKLPNDRNIVPGSERRIGGKMAWLLTDGQVIMVITAGLKIGFTPEEALAFSAWLMAYGDELERKSGF